MTGYFEYLHTIEFDEVQVTNVHFSTYLRWQSTCRDRLLRKVSPPEMRLRIDKAECEFFTLATVDDELSVRMRLEELTPTQLQFTFDYVRTSDACLVARGRQRVACVVGTEEVLVPPGVRAAALPYAETPVAG
ncbi:MULTISPECIES: acyl-CoA thioesterase [Actinokineospora]|uniref:4-hydroxybenzoyl-CoA thioesterase n=1 Tax=Actinokineospora fastidiosa TaxID=1816 RepID=A0A918GJH5_9PSEU|nr:MULTISPECIES: acyl-CoA thioesterase [Actinokineospora]UVS77646.1 tol-pal system-associated acyl-CoA thioesterase [Actinokineospora sp. UTMC 2448]GGS41983.1 4-hydroxybenzoyl-CoA thioesterase [Actinokineospora fastidiosa]